MPADVTFVNVGGCQHVNPESCVWSVWRRHAQQQGHVCDLTSLGGLETPKPSTKSNRRLVNTHTSPETPMQCSRWTCTLGWSPPLAAAPACVAAAAPCHQAPLRPVPGRTSHRTSGRRTCPVPSSQLLRAIARCEYARMEGRACVCMRMLHTGKGACREGRT